MTEQEIRDKAPSGATMWKPFKYKSGFSYFKYDGLQLMRNVGGDTWVKCRISDEHLLKPL